MPFKMHKIIFFQKKKIIRKKYVCLPYLKFSDLLPETHLIIFFIGPYQQTKKKVASSKERVSEENKKFSTDSLLSTERLVFL